ncbi:MAG: formate-dependent phosphoribosylglycinamide formyltransferase [Myxococcota bacterium]|nr:formate-dependent phosphoribosylglycinamide formyltransferase [Myxococcota bacterium]
MIQIGTPGTKSATRLMILGGMESAKETAMVAQRWGLEVIAVGNTEDEPAMHVAHRSYVIHMSNGDDLKALVAREKPHVILPCTKLVAADALVELENKGYKVVPSANAAKLGGDRLHIRRLVSGELGLPTSAYRVAETMADYWTSVGEIGFPCVVKPLHSTSGMGHSLLKGDGDTMKSWQVAQDKAHPGTCGVIIESLIDFDYEVTLLVVRHEDGSDFCEPIGHKKQVANYVESWQPCEMQGAALAQCQEMATKICDRIGGYGLFSLEFFIQGESVYFSKVCPCPHDTGLVTLISQDLSQNELHLRAALGLPIPNVRNRGPAAAAALITEKKGTDPLYQISTEALAVPDTEIRLFGESEVHGQRPLGVALALGKDLEEARTKASYVIKGIDIKLNS